MAHKVSIISGQTVPELGWNGFSGNPFNEENIGKIKDNVGNREIPISSIPSPFAQMHLFETAFKFLNEDYKIAKEKGGNLKAVMEGETTYHRIVSSCLDLYEIMYGYYNLGLDQRIKTATWMSSVLDDIAFASVTGLKTFSNTVKTYIHNYNSEKSRYQNLTPFNQFILIYFEDKIIGGTSPLTGFFTMSDSLPGNIDNHDSTNFFKTKKALYQRDADFQKYLNWLFESSPEAPTAFKSVHQYIRNCRQHIEDPGLSQVISKIGNNLSGLSDYEMPKFDLLNINNQPIYLLGTNVQYGCKPMGDFKSELKNSDYALNPTKIGKKLERPPIVLIKDSRKPNWKYYKGPMPVDIQPDRLIGIDYEKRKIPVFDLEYPCFGINDVLSKHIIQITDYNINTDKFWSVSNNECWNLLPPIKPDYFNFFTIEDLKKYLSMERLKSSKSVLVKLKLPVNGDDGKGFIEFERVYSQVDPENVESDSKGAIVNVRLGLGIYPFYRVSDNRYNDFYKIAQYYDNSIEELNSGFYRQNLSAANSTIISSNFEFDRTRRDEGMLYISKYTELATYSRDTSIKRHSGTTEDIRFDFISIQIRYKNASANGMVIPIWGEEIKLQSGGSIAFDIGTSNTHVAYAADGKPPIALSTLGSNSKKEPHLVFLHSPAKDKRDWEKFDFNDQNIPDFWPPQYTEFIPAVIDESSNFSFPIRTILNQDNDTNSTEIEDLSSLVNINIPFAFAIFNMRESFDKTYSHLKWGISDPGRTDARNRLQMFVDQLALLGRNKLIQEGIRPDKTNLIWFKPLSMGGLQSTVFVDIWDQIYKKYFAAIDQKQNLLYSITESWAPFFSHTRNFGPGKLYLNIDIGGGTTDILAFKDGHPELTTSFRFAGDNLFDDGLNVLQSKENGILIKYKKAGKASFEGKDLTKSSILEYIDKQPNLRSSDLMMFFLTQKEMVDKLKLDGDMQLIFLLHHAALFYHIAQALKLKGCDIPETIGLSGNGAKLFEITNRDKNLNKPNGILKLAELIFQKVYGLDSKPTIKFEMKENPKNSTAEGGIIGLPAIIGNQYGDTEVYSFTLGDSDTLIDGNNGKQRKEFTYNSFLMESNSILDKVGENVGDFLNLFFDDLWFDCSFTSNFGLNKSFNQQKLKMYCTDKSKIQSALRTAVQIKRDFEKEQELNETMFYYPIRALIYALSKELNDESRIDDFKN